MAPFLLSQHRPIRSDGISGGLVMLRVGGVQGIVAALEAMAFFGALSNFNASWRK
jgi:hypothetical protein